MNILSHKWLFLVQIKLQYWNLHYQCAHLGKMSDNPPLIRPTVAGISISQSYSPFKLFKPRWLILLKILSLEAAILKLAISMLILWLKLGVDLVHTTNSCQNIDNIDLSTLQAIFSDKWLFLVQILSLSDPIIKFATVMCTLWLKWGVNHIHTTSGSPYMIYSPYLASNWDFGGKITAHPRFFEDFEKIVISVLFGYLVIHPRLFGEYQTNWLIAEKTGSWSSDRVDSQGVSSWVLKIPVKLSTEFILRRSMIHDMLYSR